MKTIREVILTLNENQKYSVIKNLVDTDGNKKRAALVLNCTARHINRMIDGYKKKGKIFFVHGNKGRKPVHSLSENTKQLVIDLYRTKYSDANITHYSELLLKHEKINISPGCIRNILFEEFILSPKARRTTKKISRNISRNLVIQQNLKRKLLELLMLSSISKMLTQDAQDVQMLVKCFKWMLLIIFGLVIKKHNCI